MRSTLDHYDPLKLDFFGYFRTRGVHCYFPIYKRFDAVYNEFEKYSQVFDLCVGSDDNENFSGPQKDLITWHWKLGIVITRIQEMIREKNIEETLVKISTLNPIINTKFH